MLLILYLCAVCKLLGQLLCFCGLYCLFCPICLWLYAYAFPFWGITNNQSQSIAGYFGRYWIWRIGLRTLLANLNLANACSARKYCTQVLCMTSSRRVCIIQNTSRCQQEWTRDLTASAMETFQIESCVRGHHICNLESACDYIKIASRAGS